MDAGTGVFSKESGSFYHLLANLPDELERALAIGWESIAALRPHPARVIVVGMGTTPVVALWIREMLDSPVAIDYCRDFSLPGWANPDCLALILSGSGNSPETLSCLHDALKCGCRLAVVTRGGELQERARVLDLPLAILPAWEPGRRKNFPPMAVASMKLMETVGLAAGMDRALSDAVAFLRSPGIAPMSLDPAAEPSPRRLAQALRNKLPLVIADAQGWDALLLRWRLQFNENAKVLALVSALPDADHNTLVPLCSSINDPSRTGIVWLETGAGSDDREERKRGSLDLLRNAGHAVHVVRLAGKNKMERFFHGLWWADMVSWELGVLNGVDPSEVNIIDSLRFSKP